MKKTIIIGVSIFSLMFGGLVVWLGLVATSPVESSLFSVLLAIISIGVTWVVGHIYARQVQAREIQNLNTSHEKNLKMYALKAAEKVTNLSNELDRLNEYLSQYLDCVDDDDFETVLRVRDERLTGAIHIIGMLRSVNDGALSDWEGVIGEELNMKRVEEEEKDVERDEQIKEMLDAVNEMVTKTNSLKLQNGSRENALPTADRQLLENLNMVLAETANLYGNRNLRAHSLPFRSKSTMVSCPCCSNGVSVRLNNKGVRTGGVICKNCNSRLVCKTNEDGFPILLPREDVPEDVSCPVCDTTTEILLDNVVGGHTSAPCSICETTLNVSRSRNGLSVKLHTQTPKPLAQQPKRLPITTEFIEEVKAALPEQPWPKGVHKSVAVELKTSGTRVHRAIQELIKSNAVFHQSDGVLYQLVKPVEDTALDEN